MRTLLALMRLDGDFFPEIDRLLTAQGDISLSGGFEKGIKAVSLEAMALEGNIDRPKGGELLRREKDGRGEEGRAKVIVVVRDAWAVWRERGEGLWTEFLGGRKGNGDLGNRGQSERHGERELIKRRPAPVQRGGFAPIEA